jgi:hypothetical protein
MKTVQTYWLEPRDAERDGARRLRVASRTARPRPAWARLYVGLGMIAAAGTAAHVVATGALLAQVVDAAFGVAVFGVLAAWVHLNRLALTRSDEPEAGTGRPQVRIVRSRARTAAQAYADDGVVRLAPDERVVLPYASDDPGAAARRHGGA